jgi:hypothetical protein
MAEVDNSDRINEVDVENLKLEMEHLREAMRRLQQPKPLQHYLMLMDLKDHTNVQHLKELIIKNLS